MATRGILLVKRLGSPDSTSVADVRRYLGEFLMDPYVIDSPWPIRRLVVSGFILPFRPKRSAHAYQQVWTPAGSPLLTGTEGLTRARSRLSEAVEASFPRLFQVVDPAPLIERWLDETPPRSPYLRGVACPTERPLAGDEPARGGDWEVRLTPSQVSRALARYGDVGEVHDLLPTKVGVSGRVVELSVVGSAGELDLRGMHVSQVLGLRESLFVIHRETGDEGEIERFVITGKGWGHGVGLCQVGASGMAQSGASFEAILKHYYTGIAVQPLANFDTRRSPS